MKNRIPFLRPNLVRHESYAGFLEEIDKTHIYSNYGPLNTRFEQLLLEEFFENQGALTTVANATLGLMLAISICRRPDKRYAIMPSFTFAATPLAAMWCGLEPYFVDIDPHTWSLDIAHVEQALTDIGDETAVIVPYATFGADINLKQYADWHMSDLPVVIDAASSLGTVDDHRHFGQGFPGTVVFSLHATKSFPIGEGGVIYSEDKETVSRLRQMANFGFTPDRISTLPGLNAKLSEMHAAVALATLDQFEAKKKIRQKIECWYHELFEEYSLLQSGWRFQSTTGSLVRQFVPALCPASLTNRTIIDLLDKHGIEGRAYFQPSCHEQPSFKGFPHVSMKVTESIANRIVSLPLWEEMTLADIKKIVSVLKLACVMP